MFASLKVALPRQLEEIGSMCSLHRSADISSRLGDLGDVCWEIKRKAEVTTLCWNWPEVCPGPGAGDPAFLLRLHALSTQSWLFEMCLALLLLKKVYGKWCDRREEGQSYMFIWWIDNCTCSNDWWLFLLFCRIMDPWFGARITSSAPR